MASGGDFKERAMRMVRSPGAGFIFRFAVLCLCGFSFIINPTVTKHLIEPFTASLVTVCTFLINLFGGHAQHQGSILSFSDGPGAVQVLNGCNAVEVCVLLAAAIIAFPGKLTHGLIGALAAIISVQVLNLLRIISLLFLARYAPQVFDFAHLYLWDALIMLDGVVAFTLWRTWQARIEAREAQTGAAA